MALKKKIPNDKLTGLPGLDLGEIERVLAFMCQHNLEQFEFSLGDLHIALKRGATGAAQTLAARPAPATAAAGPGQLNEPAAAPSKPAAAAPSAPEDHVVKSPIVGTFYTSPSPDAPSFVKVGDHVSKGQVICIVEAMKLMNEIEADVTGTLTRVLVENNQPVEYGQPLFAIRPNGKA
jgi:acetyl-CoA carboxylase biotin carboxyl carrier protein